MTIPDSPAPGTARGVAAIPSIAVVDDEAATREMVGDYLKLHGFAVVLCDGGRALREHLAHHSPDLIVLDLNMPEEDGLSIVRDLKARTAIPIIMLTAQESDDDMVEGLEAGANDYVVKPFKFAVLLARIRVQLRQHEASEDAVFRIGPYTFRPGAKLLVGERGSKLKLTEKETAILRYLYRAGREVVGRDTLLAEVWGYNAHVTTHTLETHIYRLRQKIEPNPAMAAILVTEGGGYKLLP